MKNNSTNTIKVGKKTYTKKQIQESIKHWQKVLEGMDNGKFYCIVCKAHVSDNNFIQIYDNLDQMINMCAMYSSENLDIDEKQLREIYLKGLKERRAIHTMIEFVDEMYEWFFEISSKERNEMLSQMKSVADDSDPEDLIQTENKIDFRCSSEEGETYLNSIIRKYNLSTRNPIEIQN